MSVPKEKRIVVRTVEHDDRLDGVGGGRLTADGKPTKRPHGDGIGKGECSKTVDDRPTSAAGAAILHRGRRRHEVPIDRPQDFLGKRPKRPFEILERRFRQ